MKNMEKKKTFEICINDFYSVRFIFMNLFNGNEIAF